MLAIVTILGTEGRINRVASRRVAGDPFTARGARFRSFSRFKRSQLIIDAN